jgi:Ras family
MELDRIIEVRRVRCWCMILRDPLHLLQRHLGYQTCVRMPTLILPSVWSPLILVLECCLRAVLVGNKADLVQDRKVTTEEARQWARENDVSVCVESSAKSGDGVEDAFQKVAEEVFRKIRDGVFDLSDKVPSSLYLITSYSLMFLARMLTLVNGDQGESTQEFGADKSRD